MSDYRRTHADDPETSTAAAVEASTARDTSIRDLVLNLHWLAGTRGLTEAELKIAFKDTWPGTKVCLHGPPSLRRTLADEGYILETPRRRHNAETGKWQVVWVVQEGAVVPLPHPRPKRDRSIPLVYEDAEGRVLAVGKRPF